MTSLYDPDGTRLPIKVDTTSNGEFAPRPLPRAARAANALARAWAGEGARALGLSRRAFLTSAAGVASTLLAFNAAHRAHAAPGGFFDLPREAARDEALARAALGGPQFIFDVQGHHVSPRGAWRGRLGERARPLRQFPNAACGDGDKDDPLGYLACFDAEHFVKDVFLDSETTLAVLSFVPSTKADRPLTMEEARATQALADSMAGTGRLFLHGPVNPNTDTGLSEMEELVGKYSIVAFKAYTQWGPKGTGYWLDDPQTGLPFVEKARALGVKIVAVHKGLPFPNMPHEYSTCRDIGPVARMFPDVQFLIYHSGFEAGVREGPYSETGPARGVDTLIRSLAENGIGPGSNVHAELGSTWRYLMRSPTDAAHVMGKLLKHLGPDNVLWGTDSIWYGSPQDQIDAFRAFQIAPELREAHGYPEITPEIRAKIFGLNGARVYGIDPATALRRASLDWVGMRRQAYLEAPDPTFATHGPRTAAEFSAFKALHGEGP